MSSAADDPYSAPQAPTTPGAVIETVPSAIFYKRNELREMAWKILAVILCVKLADYIAWIGHSSSQYSGMGWSAIPILTMLWFIGWSYWQSRRYHAIPDDDDNRNEITIGILAVLQRVGFSVIGVYLIATEASDFILAALHAYNAVSGLYIPPTWMRDSGAAIAFVAGFFLFFGANSISRLWFRIRSFGA